MSDIIQLLPDSVANQIAAGEVIQRPASVIKELVENAIDAQANSIQIIVKDAGRTLIQVIDNGKGMSATDARLAFERHATSKIRSAADLFSLNTMGFRGEALASIAAIAHVELRTRREEDEVGTKIEISASKVESQESVSCPVGSNFAVKNIFFNVPARRKFLKSNQVELSTIISEIERIALVNCEVSFTFVHNDIEMMNIPVSNLRQRILNVFGKNINQQLLTVDVDTSIVTIRGYIGKPESARKRNALQYFFVNNRYMRHSYFHKAVMQSYEQLLPTGDMPNYFLYFTIDPASIDVNIHPTKTEIKFENEQPIWQIINASVKEALGKFSAVPSIDFDMTDAPEIPIFNSSGGGSGGIQPPKPTFNPSYNPFNKEYSEIKKPDFNWDSLYKGFQAESNVPDESEEFSAPATYQSSDSFYQEPAVKPQSKVEPVIQVTENSGQHLQFKGRYVLTSVKSGLMIIDQHRAHTRVLYDQYINNIASQKGVSQGVIFPEIVTFSSSDEQILKEITEDLNCLGFDLSYMGNCSYAINGIPSGIEGVKIDNLLHSMIDTAKEKGRNVKEDIHERIALTLAEAAAIPYGQILSSNEMEHLIDNLFACASPNFTPDGKTILNVVSNDEIFKRFK